MFARLAVVWVGLLIGLVTAEGAFAQDIQRAKLKKLDIEKRTIIITLDGKELELPLTDESRVIGVRGNNLAEKLKAFQAGVDLQGTKDGADIFIRVGTRDGKDVVLGITAAAPGEEVPRAPQVERGTIKAIDLDAKTITITADGKDRELAILDSTNVLNEPGSTLTEKLKDFKAGTEVRFQAGERAGKQVLLAIASNAPQEERERTPVSPDHKDFKPLTELGAEKYQDFAGGLYPDGKNERHAAHEAAGLKLTAEVQPLDAAGKPAANGKVVLLSIGMSNASQASQGFRQALQGFEDKHPALVFVDGAQGGMTAEAIDDPADEGRGTQYWSVVDDRLKQAGVSREQVQAAWIKQADGGPRQGFPGYAKKLQGEMKTIVQILAERFPNLKLCYLSSRTYGGYATTTLNPEPYAYESGFAVKWLIEEQLNDDPELNYDPAKGAVKAPWLSWGAYLWANGATKRADGFFYEPTDFGADGTHHSPAGSRKVGQLMLEFFQSDSTAKPWFVKP